MPPFKDEHILIIVPGSQTTLAQLGLPESFTPASHRFPTRMFLAPDGKTWEPYRIFERPKRPTVDGTVMGETPEEHSVELLELPDDDQNAIWPLKEGRIEDLPAFLAFLQHIHNTLSPTLHTPILLVGQPCWTAKNHEDITQFIFEKFKTPGLCIIDSAIATTYAFGVANATVIDVGYEKIDITAIIDFVISARGTVPESGGEAMTRQLMKLLEKENFTRDMAEQLKKSPICEILPFGTPLPENSGPTETDQTVQNNPIAAPLTVDTAFIVDDKTSETVQEKFDDKVIEEEGVLDIATIVSGGKTQEFLAKKEKEKLERAAARKATREAEKAESSTAINKPIKLPNSKRPRAIFQYEVSIKDVSDLKKYDPPISQSDNITASEEKTHEEKNLNALVPSDHLVSVQDDTHQEEQHKDEKKKDGEQFYRIQSTEIGTERFQAASSDFMDAIADTIYRTILSIDDITRRQDAWESLIICGMGSKVRGFKDSLLSTLNNRFLVSPNSASLFNGELPSSLGTPLSAGAMTPVGAFSSVTHAPFTASAVNPLLHAATTTSNNTHLNLYSHQATAAPPPYNNNQNSRSQSPTSIKLVNSPTYFPEWKQYEEAVFLGSQVAAKVLFVNDQGQSKGYLSRMEFNEDGPTAIHQVGLVY